MTISLWILREDQHDIKVAEERLSNPGKVWTQEELEQEKDLEPENEKEPTWVEIKPRKK